MQTSFIVGQSVTWKFGEGRYASVSGTIREIGKKRIRVEIHWCCNHPSELKWISPRQLSLT